MSRSTWSPTSGHKRSAIYINYTSWGCCGGVWCWGPVLGSMLVGSLLVFLVDSQLGLVAKFIYG